MPPTTTVVDEYVDANENFSKSNEEKKQTIIEAIPEMQQFIEMFFSNKFAEARQLCEERLDDHYYSHLALSYNAVIMALITMEKEQIDYSTEVAQNAQRAINKKRKSTGLRQSLVNIFAKVDYSEYTDEEAHAALAYGEVSVMTVFNIVLGERSLMALVRCAKSLYDSYSCIKTCNEILKHKKNWPSGDVVRRNFECGTHMTWGFLNMLLSHLPAKVMKMVSFIGFDCDREEALRQVHIATDEMSDCVRSKIASFILCLYEFYLEQFFGLGDANIDWVRRVTDENLRRFPDGCFDLYWSGRVAQLGGYNDKAISLLQQAKSKTDFKGIHTMVTWDTLWCYAMQCNWKRAAEIAKELQSTCKWSPATNAYQYACFMYMIMEEENRPELRAVVDEAMAEVPTLRSRYAGKTIPPEKFAIEMANRYNDGDRDQVLPVMMLFYIWNIFGQSKENPGLLKPLLERIQSKLMKQRPRSDSYFLLTLLKGVCLRYGGQFEEALECFSLILSNEKQLVKDTHVAPHAALELGLTYLSMAKLGKAKVWLEKARDEYNGFLIEAQVHLRIHGALQKLKLMKNAGKGN